MNRRLGKQAQECALLGEERVGVRFAGTFARRLRGLLFSPTTDDVLVLMPCNSIHTFGMRKPIDVAFVDAEGLVLGVFYELGPQQRLHMRGAQAVLERFARDDLWLLPGEHITVAKTGGVWDEDLSDMPCGIV